ncbi:unnamed protein product, partial [Ectocarpus sp. 12 AP-2014]
VDRRTRREIAKTRIDSGGREDFQGRLRCRHGRHLAWFQRVRAIKLVRCCGVGDDRQGVDCRAPGQTGGRVPAASDDAHHPVEEVRRV